MASIWPANALTGGGTGALDAIDGNLLSDGDGAVVIAGSAAYFYSLDATSGAAESSPDIIAPDVNPGDKRWIRQKFIWPDVGTSTLYNLQVENGVLKLVEA